MYGLMNGANSDNAVSIQTMVTRTMGTQKMVGRNMVSRNMVTPNQSEHGWLEPGYSEHGLSEPGYSEHGYSEVTWNPVTPNTTILWCSTSVISQKIQTPGKIFHLILFQQKP